MSAANKDREALRNLAKRWMALASLPVMADRRRQWTALKDLQAERPMVIFETDFLENYVREDELTCTDASLRAVEKSMLWHIRHAEEVGDDTVVEPFYRIYWDIDWPDYGVALPYERVEDGMGGQVGFAYTHPIKMTQDLDKLKPRTWQVDRTRTLQRHEQLSSLFGDILPVELHGTGGLHSGLTSDLFKLLGNNNLLQWTFDEPEALHRVMAFLRDDRLAYFTWLEAEGLLGSNYDGWELVGSGSPGYTTRLPQPGGNGKTRLCDIWVWMESQETTMISPKMCAEYFLPYMAAICTHFGRVYYGCCEPVHDRWDATVKAIPNIGAVSISPWCNQKVMGEKLGKSAVYSRKPQAWPITAQNPDWDALSKDLDETLAAARNCNLEIIFRDVYRIHEDRPRLRQWVEMVRAKIGK
jgi:hypothetical protein